jgi:UDP-glucuronate decarboxylase
MKTNLAKPGPDDVATIIENLGADVQRFSGKTVLLSGGAGFLGRHFISVFRRLNQEVLPKPCKVISADNYITGDQSAEAFCS